MSLALLRYTAAIAARSQRLLAPTLCFLAALAVINTSGGPSLATYATTGAVLFPASLWLSVAALSSEDPQVAAVTATSAGGVARTRLAKLVVAAGAGSALAVVSVLCVAAVGGTTPVHALVGFGGLLCSVVFGVALGALLALIRHVAWTVLAGIGVTLAEVLIPHLPPVRQLLMRFGQDRPTHVVLGLVWIAAQTAVISVAAAAIAHRLARRAA